MDGSTSMLRHEILTLDRTLLAQSEAAVFDKQADRNGIVQHPDIDFLLRQNVFLRQLIGRLVASTGKPMKDDKHGGWYTTVPADALEQIAFEGDYSGLGEEDGLY